jgi:uncharacterized membrane protein YgaE (UPF0421/DUF939 family)
MMKFNWSSLATSAVAIVGAIIPVVLLSPKIYFPAEWSGASVGIATAILGEILVMITKKNPPQGGRKEKSDEVQS